tara:strand:- start:863 stop:1861 length:999 start_codon:yes stop_codon:yes gene_type:complete
MNLNFRKIIIFFLLYPILLFINTNVKGEEVREILESIQKDLRTLERAVYSESFSAASNNSENTKIISKEEEHALTRHLLKIGEIEKQFQELTNKFEEINFKLDKLSSRLSKIQSDNQLRFQQIENSASISDEKTSLTSLPENETAKEKILPGTSQADELLGERSYKDMTSENDAQVVQTVEATTAIIQEVVQSEDKILPEGTPKEQYQFATSFLKVGDYNMAEKAFKEFVLNNPDDQLSGNAQYWYAETFRIRELYTDAASAYLEGYQKYPKSEKAPINLLKLGVSLVQIGEKDQGCLMIAGVKQQYPDATQSVLQKAKYEEKKFECKRENS